MSSESQDPIEQGYSRLTAVWEEAERRVAALKAGTRVEIPVTGWQATDDKRTPPSALSWRQHKGRWRVCVLYQIPAPKNEVVWKPVTECSAVHRIGLVGYFPRLYAEVHAARDKLMPNLNKAVAEMEDHLRLMGNGEGEK